MKIKTGYLYHIKDEFFDVVNDENLMSNKERGHTRPTYFVIKENNILWFIPLSSKVDKYKKIINNKVKKYGRCDGILIRKILGEDSAILIQNAFPTIEKYIDHVHLLNNGKPAKVIETFFTNIDKIKEEMLKELNNN